MAKSMVEIVIEAKDRFSGEMAKANSRIKDISASARKAGLVMTAMGVGGVFLGKKFIDAALEQEKAMKTLSAVVELTGVSFASVREEIEATTTAIEKKTNFSDEQQLRAMSRLVPILGDVDQALQALPLVLDAASASGLGVESVAGTLARALSGMVHTSESIGVTFEANATFAERLAIGFDTVGGAAEANADPFTQLGNAVNKVKERIGDELLPVVLPLTDAFIRLTDKLENVNPKFLQIAVLSSFAAVTLAGIVGPVLLLIGALPLMGKGFGLVKIAMVAVLGVFGSMIGWPALLAVAVSLMAVAIIRDWGDVQHIIGEGAKHIGKRLQGMVDALIGVINAVKSFHPALGLLDWLIPDIKPIKIHWEEIGESIGDGLGIAGQQVQKQWEQHIKPFLKDLPKFIVQGVDIAIGKFNAWSGESLPLLSDMLIKIEKELNAVFDSFNRPPKVEKAITEAEAPGDAAAKAWEEAQRAHELYMEAISRHRMATDTRMSGHEIALRQFAIYERSIAGGQRDIGGYGGTKQSFLDILRSGSANLSKEEREELEAGYGSSLPHVPEIVYSLEEVRELLLKKSAITLTVEGDDLAATIAAKLGMQAARTEAMGGA